MSPSPAYLPKTLFSRLLETLKQHGHRILGPRVRNGAVIWGEIQEVNDLPRGWQDRQEPGQYRVEPSGTDRFFDVVHGPESLKKFVFAPREPLLTIERQNGSLSVRPRELQADTLAILGVRACDLVGLEVQDRVFVGGPYTDRHYQVRRNGLFLIAVNCTRGVSTCFCASMNTGPRANSGFDLALTELDEGFVVEVGTPAGAEILEPLQVAMASASVLSQAASGIETCANNQTRYVDTSVLPQALYAAHDHPHWESVARRCLSCTNCTMVCPTCFCHTVEEVPDLEGQRSEQLRLWDSCFTEDHGYIHGKNIRPTIKDRYRQWLTHKFASWIDQFGSSGCVGCGRCISWCPVGIDPTEELKAFLHRPELP